MKPDRRQVDSRVEEYRALKPDPGGSELARLETALFLEESFGIRVTDDDIEGAALGTFDSVRSFLDSKMGNR